ncbi:phospholipase D-like domain-containing protein [Candidatus Erwinia dacicola]|uniref:phospholipase D-like domain-containing protein n=1 Tax=Candidatus Erwinia dacicola TaxID=252393 RepID=UPI0009F47D92|nr:hypothetical protein [Candidatus Erwinia dacicola]NJD85334.1 hypothetical protein [Candidatus Erwinia dacicola]
MNPPFLCNIKRVTVHDKVIITDDQKVELGSYNYTRSAAASNAENVLVVREMPALAHWQSRWDGGSDWQSAY